MENSTFAIRGLLLQESELAPGAVRIERNLMVEISRDSDAWPTIPKFEAGIVAPGFIDLQVNGGFGYEVGGDSAAIEHLARRLPETGVTAFLPTLITSTPEEYRDAFAAFERAQPGNGAKVLGLHLEGPYLSSRRAGIHRQDLIDAANLELLTELASSPHLRVMTLAPEREGALELIRMLLRKHILASLGHTEASFESFVQGVDAGAAMATHVFNAMSPLHHRSPNAAGAALYDDRVTVGMISDGIHVHPSVLELVLRAKGPNRIVLVTDMVRAAGMPSGTYAVGGHTVLSKNGAVRTTDGTLAGSVLAMDQSVRNMVRWTSATVAQALRMAGEIPARLLELSNVGQIQTGFEADLVLLDDTLHVTATLVAGQWVYRRGDS